MKTPEELNALKEEYKTLNKKLAELNEDELKLVIGGSDFSQYFDIKDAFGQYKFHIYNGKTDRNGFMQPSGTDK